MDIADAFVSLGQRKIAGLPLGDRGIVRTAPTAGKVDVDCDGSIETIWCGVDVQLFVGDIVVVQRNGVNAYAAARLLGSRELPVLATVTSAPPGSATITVDADGLAYEMAFLASYVPAVSDQVRISWSGGTGVILGALGSTPVPPPALPPPVVMPPAPPVAPPPPPTQGQSTFPAADARSFRGGKWRTDSAVVAQGSYGSYGDNKGAWFYAGGPGASLAGATITGCQMRLQRVSGGDYAAQAVHLYLHTSPTRPGGDVTRTADTVDVSLERFQSAWVDLPASWGQQIVNSGYGIGISGAPYVNLSGLDSDSETGLLKLTWSR